MNPKENNVKELFELYSRDILHYSMSLLKDSDDAKDAVQEVFVRFINSQSTFRGECSYKTWLLVITRNYCYKKLNGKSSKVMPISESMNETLVHNFDEKITLEEAMRKLSDEDYELIYLREYACHSYKEIAEILGISIDNVKVKLFRVREQLRKYLK
jgi:RNA polymerase sigma-70 factor (ECF subfamily)